MTEAMIRQHQQMQASYHGKNVPAFNGFSASGGFYQSGMQSGTGTNSVISEGLASTAYNQDIMRMMQNQTYSVG